MNRYQTTESIHTLGNKSYYSYGISCKGRHLQDITLSPVRIRHLVEMCNRLDLDPCHLEEVVEDFLGSLDKEETSPACQLPHSVSSQSSRVLRRRPHPLPAAQGRLRWKLHALAHICR